MEKESLSNLLLFQNYHLKKFLNIMRVSTFLLFLCVFTSFAATTRSQNAKVNIAGNNLTIGTFIDEVEKQTDYLFVYSKSEINTSEKVSLRANNKPVSECLKEVFGGKEVNYAFENDYIVLTKKGEAPAVKVAQQSKKVTGVVQDVLGPIIGANVIVKGTTNGTVTDVDGNFSLDIPTDGNVILQISYIGYLTKEIPVGNNTSFNIELIEDTQKLDEVVVVGYGTMRKSDVTGSISITKGEDMMKNQSFSALDNLRGKAAGVNIFSNSGQPGGANRVMIRGINAINTSSEPLYVVDGVVMEDFKFLNPNDIERIEVLKDASSAAIYGARGANGVIMVTTKRGLKGEGVQVSYSGSVSLSHVAKYMDVMNSEEWCDAFMTGLENENKWHVFNYDGKEDYVSSMIAAGKMDANRKWVLDRKAWFNDRDYFDADGNPLYDTDWQKEAMRTVVSHNHQLNIQQGGKNSSMGAFVNYTDQQGILLNTYMKRLNAKVAYDANPFPWLSTAVNLLVNHTWGRYTPENGGDQVPRRTMIEMVPWYPVYDKNGKYTNFASSSLGADLGFESMANPVQGLTEQKRMKYNTQIFGNMALTFHLAKDLDLKTQFGIDSHNNNYKGYSGVNIVNQSSPNGWAEMDHTTTLYWQEETYLTYNFTRDKHRLNAMAGLSWQERKLNYNKSKTEGFSDDFFGWDNMGVGTMPSTPESHWERWAMNSYFLRAAYSYDNKYMATVTGRVDGSSKFGRNNKYAFFPSVGLGWNISEEGFLKDNNVIDMLKLHTSFGVTGNSEISVYKSLPFIEQKSMLMNGGRVNYANLNTMENPDLKWEKTAQFDIGFNLNMFKNRLNFDVSFYNKKTTDLLLDCPVPHATGYETIYKNIGSVRNRGLDFMVNTVNIQTKDFTWSSTINANFNKNEILALGDTNADIESNWFVSNNNAILRVGESLSSFYGYKRLGVWTEEDFKTGACEQNEIGRAKRSSEKEILGKGIPDWTGSFINNFSYKNFDLTIDLQFVAGVQVLQQFYHSTYDRFGITNGLTNILTDGYNGSNPGTMQQAIFLSNSDHAGQNTMCDSEWVANGSYLRANLIQLGYNFSPALSKKLGVNNVRIYANVNNAFCITAKDFKGYDPEGTSQIDRTNGIETNSQWGQNMFFFQYPKARTYTLGLNVTF